ncbi:MAG: UDP-N-acetylmuramate--L-alanine ligase [Bacteroidales bacterium]|jgi:UDP-N-acetylmuramate--alanine ligase|nr:UDP-N-acetylmuramate--L-alanine ligase [Bacteroidales bacterium]
MNFDTLKHIYFLGIGGIGMSALARFFASKGIQISGYDRTRTPLCESLEREGMRIHYVEDINLLPKDIDLIVYTPAIPKDNNEFVYLQNTNIPICKRSEVLGLITEKMLGVCVAGAHGKTTITTFIAHLLTQSQVKCNAFLGGISKNYNSNLILSDTSNIAVIEADEFDRSFLKLHPKVAVISSVDADHLDIYGTKQALEQSFADFANLVPQDGILFQKYGLPNLGRACKTYHLNNPQADYFTSNLHVENGAYHFDFNTPKGILNDCIMTYPGLHNVENAVVAIAIAQTLGVTKAEILHGLEAFQGVKRRFDIHFKTPCLVYIDDYAHHPQELKACIESVKNLYPNRKVTGIFQPHLYSRTRDFADEFVQSLSLLDTLILLDIYPAREKPIEGITSKMLLDKCTCPNKILTSKTDLIETLKTQSFDVLLTMGAGDIDQCVTPITNYLKSKHNLQGDVSTALRYAQHDDTKTVH